MIRAESIGRLHLMVIAVLASAPSVVPLFVGQQVLELISAPLGLYVTLGKTVPSERAASSARSWARWKKAVRGPVPEGEAWVGRTVAS
jgi:hypothetical protein